MEKLTICCIVMVMFNSFSADASPVGGYHDSSVADIVNYENYNSGKNGYRYM